MVFVLVATTVLLLLGLRAVKQQRDAIRSLAASNALLAADRMVSEMEGRATELARECLRDAEAGGLAAATPKVGRSIAAAVESRHPIAAHLLVLEAGGMRYPRLRPRTAVLSPAPGELFEEAEREEVLVERPEQAAVMYRRCKETARTARLQALALARMARCFRKLGRKNEAAEAYRALGTTYGDESDPFGRPYALVAAFELAAPDERLYRDFVGGRWDIDAETADYFVTRLGQGDGGEFMRRFRIAAAFERSFQPLAEMNPGEMLPFSFEDQQAFVSAAPGGVFLTLEVVTK